MKRVSNLIKLTHRNSERLNENELSHAISGEEECWCSCFYSACGGSSRTDNKNENNKGGLVSPYPGNDNPNWGIVT